MSHSEHNPADKSGDDGRHRPRLLAADCADEGPGGQHDAARHRGHIYQLVVRLKRARAARAGFGERRIQIDVGERAVNFGAESLHRGAKGHTSSLDTTSMLFINTLTLRLD